MAPSDAWDELRRQIAADETLRIGGPAGDDEIAAAEAVLGRLPPGYARFVREFGWIDGQLEVFGIGVGVPHHLDVVGATLSERNELLPGLPDGYVAIAGDGAGNVYCVKTGDSEPRVFLRNHELGREEANLEEEATDFATWLLAMRADLQRDVELETLDALIRSRVEKKTVRVGRGAPGDAIAEAEAELGPLPPAYRWFVSRYGWLQSDGWGVCGLGPDAPAELDALTQTRRERRDERLELAAGFVVIDRDGHGNVECVRSGDPKSSTYFRINEFGTPTEPKRDGMTFPTFLEERLVYWGP
jgi:hypothetical protein